MLINGYSDLSLETPACHPGASAFVAKFKLDADLSELLPYINAVGQDSAYYVKARSIQFTLNGKRCSISPEHVFISRFEDRDQVEKSIGELIDFLNELDRKKDTIEPDFTQFKKVPVFDILKLLPKTNCKECGYPTCMAFAAALSEGQAAVMDCTELMDSNAENAEALRALFC